MRIVARKTLRQFRERYPRAENPLCDWYDRGEAASWRSPADIRAEFGSANFVGDKRGIFNIGGNKYRLIVRVSYTHGLVLVKFVGTHAEYDMVDPETVNGPTQHQQ